MEEIISCCAAIAACINGLVSCFTRCSEISKKESEVNLEV